ncbi:hypothetical protein ABFS83_02G107100 [Erythranthe nasuta]
MKRKKEKEEEEHKKMEKRVRGRPKKIKIAQQSHNLDEITVNHDDYLPEFFKVYVSEIYSERMRIPPDFIEKFGRKKPAIVTLKTTSGISFRADMNKINKCWYLEKGWPEFVKENSVEEGDFLTFAYGGKSVFNVKVFAKNGCIKNVDNLEEDEPSEPENRNDSRKPICENRSFAAVITKSCVRRGWLHVPSKFWKGHMKIDEKGIRSVTLWIKKKSWDVGLATLFNRVIFSRGWIKFARDNSLRDGNLCTFRLINGSDSALSVTIK